MFLGLEGEAQIYSQTDLFSDYRLQKSMHSSNSDRLSEQQGTLALLQYTEIKKKITSKNAF